jgi:hypothetical protein
MKRAAFMLAGATALLVSVSGVGRADVSAAPAVTQLGHSGFVRAVVADDDVPVVRLTADAGPEEAGEAISELDSSGQAPVNVVVIGGNDGRAIRVEGRFGTWGIRLPAFSATPSPRRAVIRVIETGVGDSLEPRLADFRFGSAWKLDEVSDGSDADNGDNVLQRGLAGDDGQYKLQVDHRVPMCTVKGDEGLVVARAKRVQPEVWYRTRCLRQGDTVSIRVWELTDGGAVLFDSTTASGSMGSVKFSEGTPLSVGGKLTSGGKLVSDSGDQLNGVVDNMVYDTID